MLRNGSSNMQAAVRIASRTHIWILKHTILQVLDGPSCTLLDYMRTHNFCAPASWKGYRELTEK